MAREQEDDEDEGEPVRSKPTKKEDEEEQEDHQMGKEQHGGTVREDLVGAASAKRAQARQDDQGALS